MSRFHESWEVWPGPGDLDAFSLEPTFLAKIKTIPLRSVGRVYMGLLSNTQNCGLRMRREYRERFPRQRLQRKPLASDPGMHHGTCVTHVPWCMSGSSNRSGGENVPGIPGACATRNFRYLVRGPWTLTDYCWLLSVWTLCGLNCMTNGCLNHRPHLRQVSVPDLTVL